VWRFGCLAGEEGGGRCTRGEGVAVPRASAFGWRFAGVSGGGVCGVGWRGAVQELFQLEILWPDTRLEFAKAEVGGFVGADVIDPGVGLHLVGETGCPVGGVHDEAAQVSAFEVDAGADGGGDDFRGVTGGADVVAEPDDGHHGGVFGSGDWGVGGFHAGEHLAVDEDLGILGEVADSVDIGWTPDIRDTAEDGMIFEFGIDDAASTFGAVVAVVIDPGIAKELLTEAAGPFAAAVIVFGVGALFIAFVGEGVGGGADTEDGFAGIDEVDEVFHVRVGQFPESEEQDEHIGLIEGGQAGDVGLVDGVDGAVLGVEGEEDGASKAVVDGEDAGEHGHGLFRAVFLIAGEQDDMLTLTGARRPLVDEGSGGLGDGGGGGEGEGAEQGEQYQAT